MAVRNLEIRKQGEGYSILEQAGSNSHKDNPVHQSPNREDAVAWLTQQGAGAEEAQIALNDLASAERAFIEVAEGYSQSENFPKRYGP